MTINEKNLQHEQDFDNYVKNAHIDEYKIFDLSSQSEKWHQLYLETFMHSSIKSGNLTDETLAYFGKLVAVVVTKANFKRSGNRFDYKLYLSVCGYDYFTGNQIFDNVGGDEIISESIIGLLTAMQHGAVTLDDEVIIDGTQKTAFKLACQYINKYIHSQRNYLENISGFDVERVIAINTKIRDTVSAERYEILENIISHLRLTPLMLRYLDYAVNGMSRREIARLENKDHTTILESFRSIKKKFTKYCLENQIDETVADFLSLYID